MARISILDFEKRNSERIKLQETVKSTFCSFYDGEKKYFQIDTYGSENRKNYGQPSQKIQFDKEMAIELIKIIKEEFNI